MIETVIAFILGVILSAVCFFVFYTSKKAEFNGKIIKLSAELEAKKKMEESKDDLFELIKKEFSLCANEILIEKQKTLQEQNKESLEVFLNPLKERIKEFQIKVEQCDENGKINAAALKEKIEELVRQNQLTVSSTEKLSEAISQNSKFRGSLGEFILEKLLKSSGLVNKKDDPKRGNYETQIGYKASDGLDGGGIIDAVVYLTDGKSIVVDSKASLVEFMNFTESKDDEEGKIHLQAFINDVWARVKELSGKYTNLEGLATPDFTIMFIPFEYPVSYIYSNNKLIEDAIRQNVIIAGPSTLIATLRTINYSWAQKNQYENIQDITRLGASIYDKCVMFIQKMEEVQISFETLKKKFDGVFKTARGRNGLVGQVEKLKEFGLSPSKQIEEKYLEDETEVLAAPVQE